MATGYLRWYRSRMLEYDVALQLERMAKAGLTFEGPETPPAAERLVASADVTEQLRTPSGATIPVQFQTVREDVLLQHYILDLSVSTNDADLIESVVWDGLRHELHATLAFVVDRVGHARKVDWDALVVEGSLEMKRLPEVLLLREPNDREEEAPFRRFSLFEHRVD